MPLHINQSENATVKNSWASGPDYLKILHMPWQLCCHGMCKIFQWSVGQDQNEIYTKVELQWENCWWNGPKRRFSVANTGPMQARYVMETECQSYIDIMMWHGNTPHFIGPLCRESADGFPAQRASNWELWWSLCYPPIKQRSGRWNKMSLHSHDINIMDKI